MSRILLTVFIALFFIPANAQKTNKREVRGAWITTYLGLDWPVKTQTPAQQQGALQTILDHHKATGLNTVYFQVRSQSDAMYESTLEPWSYDLQGTAGVAPVPSWDPLHFASGESHKRGLEFHAWINPFRAIANTANANNTNMYPAMHVSKTHPEWMLTVGTVQIINPGIPAARAHIINVITDIVKRYDIDGIHFDDYFYPSGTINDNDAYVADPRGFPNTASGIADWRRDNINLFITTVYDSIKTIKPWVKFGISPSGIYRSSTDPAVGSNTSAGAYQHYSAAFADTKKWLQQGWVDYIAPQVYWYRGQAGSDYNVLVQWWNNNAAGRHIYIGIAAYKVNDPAAGAVWANAGEVPNQVRLNRNTSYPNVLGSIFFRTQHLVNNAISFRDSLRLNLFARPALQPTMLWRDAVPPQPASAVTAISYGNDSVVVKWVKPAVATNELDKAKQFVIYRSTNAAVNTEDPANILAITTIDTSAYRDVSTSANTTYYYAVTALDRFHNESALSNVASVNTITSITGLPSVKILHILAMPNPSSNQFQIKIESGSGAEVKLSVVNVYGQLIESMEGIKPGTSLSFGAGYAAGVYFIEAVQGARKTSMKLVKLP